MRSKNLTHTVAQHGISTFVGDTNKAIVSLESSDQSYSPLTLCNLGEMPTAPIKITPQVITALGGNPQQVFKAAGIDLHAFINDHEQRLGYNEISRLFNTAIQHTQCSSIGILVGLGFSLKNLGPIGQLMLSASTVEEALHDLVTHSKLHDRGGAPLLLPLNDQLSLLGYVIHSHDVIDPRSLIDVLIMIGFQTLRELLGPDWTPVRVQLAYHKPPDSAAYARVFRCPVQFNANVSGLVVSTPKLGQKLKTAKPLAGQKRSFRVYQIMGDSNIALVARVDLVAMTRSLVAYRQAVAMPRFSPWRSRGAGNDGAPWSPPAGGSGIGR